MQRAQSSDELLPGRRLFITAALFTLLANAGLPVRAQPPAGNAAVIDVRIHGAKCDGKTDDAAAIDRAIAALPDGGGTLWFPPGVTCLTSGGHRLPSHTTVRAAGAVVRRKTDPDLESGRLAHLFMALDGTQNLRVEGGTFDLNRDAFRDRERKGLTLSAFFLRRHTGAVFRDVTVRNGPENALKFWNVREISLSGCRFENFYNVIVEFNNPKIDGAPLDIPAPESGHYEIRDCYFQDVDDFLNGAGNGCGIAVAGTTLQPHRQVRIENNTFVGCNRAIWFESEGKGMEAVDVRVVGNTIIGSLTGSETLHGIGLVGVQRGLVERNTILNVGSTSKTVSEPAGITVSGSATVESSELRLHGNVIRDLRSPPHNHTRYGILLTRGERLKVSGNLVSGANAGQIEVRTGVRESQVQERMLGD
jgi:polygalacturonase